MSPAAPASTLPPHISHTLAEARRLAGAQRLEEAEALLGRYPDEPNCTFRRGGVLLTLERFAEAEACFRRVLKVAPGHMDSRLGLAGALVGLGRAAEAVPLLDGAVKAQPNVGRLRYLRGIALAGSGREAEAAPDLAFARQSLIAPLSKRNNLPFEVYVQVSRRCNLRCAMCGWEVWKNNIGFMEWDVFERVLAECKANGIKTMHILAAQGEPLLNPNIFEMLERAVAEGMEVGMVTNGTPLTPERIKRLAGIGLSYLQFSFAGWDKESYEKVYVGSKFERTVENLKLTAQAMAGAKTNFMVKAVASGEEWATVKERTRTFLAGLGIERVYTIVANNFGGSVQCGTFNERHGVWSMKSIDHHRRMPCRILLKAIGIYCDGTVTACGCYDSNGELKIGHIMEQSMAEIRNGEPFLKILEAFRQGDVSHIPMCSKCDDPFG